MPLVGLLVILLYLLILLLLYHHRLPAVVLFGITVVVLPTLTGQAVNLD